MKPIFIYYLVLNSELKNISWRLFFYFLNIFLSYLRERGTNDLYTPPPLFLDGVKYTPVPRSDSTKQNRDMIFQYLLSGGNRRFLG